VPPQPVVVSRVAVAAIATLHHLDITHVEPLPSIGIINTVYGLDDRYVLRVPRNHPAHVDQAYREAAAIPAALAAGVRTPPVVVFDESLSILPVPFLIVERVRGEDVESTGLAPAGLPLAWRELGIDLARLHEGVVPTAWRTEPGPDEVEDPHALVDRRSSEGWFSSYEATRLHAWLERLTAACGPEADPVLVHGDLQMSNVLIDPPSGRYVALIDWGCARRADPAIDLRVVPMAALAPLLTGYREVAGSNGQVSEAGILRRKLQLDLWALSRGPQAGRSWGEQALARMVDLFLHLAETTSDDRWTDLMPG
jgi:aminoglycoside phosphotransferase (APT) family kinase protein